MYMTKYDDTQNQKFEKKSYQIIGEWIDSKPEMEVEFQKDNELDWNGIDLTIKKSSTGTKINCGLRHTNNDKFLVRLTRNYIYVKEDGTYLTNYHWSDIRQWNFFNKKNLIFTNNEGEIWSCDYRSLKDAISRDWQIIYHKMDKVFARIIKSNGDYIKLETNTKKPNKVINHIIGESEFTYEVTILKHRDAQFRTFKFNYPKLKVEEFDEYTFEIVFDIRNSNLMKKLN